MDEEHGHDGQVVRQFLETSRQYLTMPPVEQEHRDEALRARARALVRPAPPGASSTRHGLPVQWAGTFARRHRFP